MSDPIPSAPVPAAMPGESLVEQIAAFLLLRDEMVTDPDERTDDERAESAQEIANLFAPILAEKERLECALEEMERVSEMHREKRHEEAARALAAEAAATRLTEENEALSHIAGAAMAERDKAKDALAGGEGAVREGSCCRG